MRDPRIAHSFIHRGCVWLFYRFLFEVAEGKSKYCVLLEDCALEHADEPRHTIIVALTTSNLKYSDKPWTVLIPHGSLEKLQGDSLVDLNNYAEIRTETFYRCSSCEYIGELPQELLAQIDEALTYATRLAPDIIVRVRPKPRS